MAGCLDGAAGGDTSGVVEDGADGAAALRICGREAGYPGCTGGTKSGEGGGATKETAAGKCIVSHIRNISNTDDG